MGNVEPTPACGGFQAFECSAGREMLFTFASEIFLGARSFFRSSIGKCILTTVFANLCRLDACLPFTRRMNHGP